MSGKKLNEDYLLLLIEEHGLISPRTLAIDKHFERENEKLSELCGTNGIDNIEQIVSFINNSLQPKLPNKIFNYCKELDKAYQSVRINVADEIKEILGKRELIFTNQKLALKDDKDYDLGSKFRELKSIIREKLELWFKAFDIELAYEKAKGIPNVLVYSHRVSGWSNPEYKITNYLYQEVKTNFGYGSVSYFFSLLTYKNIQITPLSEWIDYRYSNFSEVIRYTRSFRDRIPVTDEKGYIRYFKTKIENEFWHNALLFTTNAANLSITNENEFIDKYILSECEAMVNGLEDIYRNNEFDLYEEDIINNEEKISKRYRLSLTGSELIDFKTEKIIGALDFIGKIMEYNSIIPTFEYVHRIKSLSTKFIPNVYSALQREEKELKSVEIDFGIFIIEHKKLIQKKEFFRTERNRLLIDFHSTYNSEYVHFQEIWKNSLDSLAKYNQKINLYNQNIKKLRFFIKKYQNFIDG